MQQRHLWLKFYPKDWNGDHNLRACSLAARGLMASFLEPMHEAEPYGHLLVRGKKPTDTELAVIASCKVREVRDGIAELVEKGVLSTTKVNHNITHDDGILFSRRMVRDKKRARKRSENGKKGGNPHLVPQSVPTRAIQPAQRVTPTKVNYEVNHIDNHLDKPIDTRYQKPEYQKPDKTTVTEQQSSVPAENAPAPTRAFLNWFQGEYRARRQGATYFVRWDSHSAIVKRLLTTFPMDRLKKHAQILLTTDEEWTTGTDRGVEILSAKINWLEERLCAWEAKRRARESV